MATKNKVPNANGEGSIGTAAKGWGGAFLTSTATSSTSAGAKLQLISNDGAVMADTHQLGIIEFLGAEDGSGTISLGASIEAVADETFTASENASALVFKTTSGTTVSEVLRLDKDKNATFAGTITADAGIDIDNFNIDGTTISLSSGNMIIGTANAASALTISDYGLLTMTVGASSNPRISFAGTNVSGTHFIQLDRGSGASTSSFEVYLNGATKFEVKADGNVEIADGSLVIANAGDGINFGATSDASGMSAEVLDDYEEGSWTPRVTDGTDVAQSNGTYTRGDYTKIGRLVHCSGQIVLTDLTSSGGAEVNGAIRMDGFPFANRNVQGAQSTGMIGSASFLNITAGHTVVLQMLLNVAEAGFRLTDSTGGTTDMQASEFSDDGQITFSISYMTDL